MKLGETILHKLQRELLFIIYTVDLAGIYAEFQVLKNKQIATILSDMDAEIQVLNQAGKIPQNKIRYDAGSANW